MGIDLLRQVHFEGMAKLQENKFSMALNEDACVVHCLALLLTYTHRPHTTLPPHTPTLSLHVAGTDFDGDSQPDPAICFCTTASTSSVTMAGRSVTMASSGGRSSTLANTNTVTASTTASSTTATASATASSTTATAQPSQWACHPSPYHLLMILASHIQHKGESL